MDSRRLESSGNSTMEEDMCMTTQLASGVTLNKTFKLLHFDILVPTPISRG